MKTILNHLSGHNTLSRNEAREVLRGIAENRYNQSHVISFLTIYMLRKITVEELEGFRDALLELRIPVDLNEFDTIDLCGTGGDGKNTFNISTLSSFVLAGTGAKVAKHGNYGVSSVCGSSNVLEFLGVKFTASESVLKRQLEEAGICFLHAPLFHPALKNVGAIRKELGVRTFFNMLGPLVNPAQPKKQVTGVFDLELARLYSYLFQRSETKYSIVYSLDRFDEISLTGPFKLIGRNRESLLEPADMGFQKIREADLYGGETVEEAAGIFLKILKNKGTKEQEQVVLANSALAIQCYYANERMQDCIEIAKESLRSGNAYNSFEKLVRIDGRLN